MYYGYLLTAEDKYLNASFKTLQYADDYFMSPMYEVLLYFAPFLGYVKVHVDAAPLDLPVIIWYEYLIQKEGSLCTRSSWALA